MAKKVVVDEHDIKFSVKERAPDVLPAWYEQFLRLSSKKRSEISEKVLALIKKNNPEAYGFIKNAGCKLVGITPRIVYALIDESKGDIDVSWIHSFSMATCLFWCEKGKFGFFINPNLRYDETVLDQVKGNSKNSLKGFTG